MERIVSRGKEIEWPEGMSAMDVTELGCGKYSTESILVYFKRREYTCAMFRQQDFGRQVHLVGWLVDGFHPQDRMLLRTV